jgi:copper(I)-binding protein
MVPSNFTACPAAAVPGRAAIALLGVAAMLAGCGGPRELTVSDAWVRLAAVAGRPAAAYFTVHGGPKPMTLISVSGDLAIRAEMHRSMTTGGGMAAMTPLPRVPIPAGGDIAFAPGGRHVMLFGVNPRAKAGGTMTLTFTFANGDRIPLVADVVGAGDPKPE